VIDSLRTGGAQSVLYGTVRYSDPSRIRNWVVALGYHHNDAFVRRVRKSSEGLFFVGLEGMWDLRAVASLRRVIQRLHIDVLHTHLPLSDFSGGLAGAITRTPVVSTLHSLATHRETYPLPRRVLANFATTRLADHLIAVSEAVQETHRNALGIPRSKIETIPNVPLAPLLLPDGFDREAKRAELGVSSQDLVCNVASLTDTKDQETLLHALQRVVSERPYVVTVIAGEGPERHRLEGLARQLGLQGAVRFLGDRSDAVEVMAASDVACQLTLEFEGLPITVLDAMIVGLPLIATGVGGVREVIEDGRTGILVPPRDVEAVSQALLRLLKSPQERAGIAAAARQRLSAGLDPKAWIDRIQAIYLGLAEREEPTPVGRR
jgi:glycosyltransferase involved in cell wall biosynthesis